MLKRITRLFVPVTAFAGGFLLFPREWRKNHLKDQKINSFNQDILNQITQTQQYRELLNDPSYENISLTQSFPSQHRSNHVASGLLFGPNLMEIDPVVFLDEKKGQLTSFYHLGSQLVSQDGLIHNGVTSTILDEGLCVCGFPLLPSKKGVTAKLSINFLNQAPPQSTVVLKAKVTSAKGRKVVIEGNLETVPLDGSEPIPIANAECILVEPKWFKYLSWLQIF